MSVQYLLFIKWIFMYKFNTCLDLLGIDCVLGVLTIHSSRNYRVFRIGAFRISIVKFVCIPFHVISFLDFIEMMYIVCTLYCTVYLAFRRYSLLFYDYIYIFINWFITALH